MNEISAARLLQSVLRLTGAGQSDRASSGDEALRASLAMRGVEGDDVMSHKTEAAAGVGAGGLGWLVGLPPYLMAAVVLGIAVTAALGRWLLAREATRQERVRWVGALEIYEAGGDGAAVARAMRSCSHATTRRPDHS
jgi:hypothetical protein